MSSQRPPAELQTSETFRKLARETGKIDWKTLSPHLESGSLVLVKNSLDLVRVAYCFAEDDRQAVATWLEAGEVARVEAEQAEDWNQSEPEFWAVVVAPWVLIQPVAQASH